MSLSNFFSVTRVQGSTLVLRKIKRSQMGNYLCIASNGFRPAVSRRVRLNVNCEYYLTTIHGASTWRRWICVCNLFSVRPVINVQEPNIYAKVGDKVVLECVIEAFPLGIYYWESHKGNVYFVLSHHTMKDWHRRTTSQGDNNFVQSISIRW